MNHYYSKNPDSISDKREVKVRVFDKLYTFFTDNGVFSRSGLDFGSRLLMETINDIKGDVLDIGCGYGPIGIVLADNYDTSVTMSDINSRAIELSKLNAEKNKVSVNIVHGDMYENITGKYDFIVTNPPIRIGKTLLLKLLKDAKKYLNRNGKLWFVIRKKQGAESVIKALSDTYKCEIVKKRKGFYIIVCNSIDL